MHTAIQLISAQAHNQAGAGDTRHIRMDNDADPREVALDEVQRVDLNFPKFTDGRAYSQAFLLRRRIGFKGEIRATGDILVDQLVQLRRAGFDSAVLRDGTRPEVVERQFARFAQFYQGDAVTPAPRFARQAPIQRAADGASHGSPDAAGTTNAVAQNARPSADFDAKLERTKALLRQLAHAHARPAGASAPAIALACSLGAEDMVLSHLINQLALDVGIFVLQTGKLHPHTLALLARLKAESRAPVDVFEPRNDAVLRFVAREGEDAMFNSVDLRKACCAIRKMEPLARALDGKTAWITGLRREQSGARAKVPELDQSDPQRAKLNPLADWSWGDVWHYIAVHGVAYNPLHDQFYPSIGCAPCTRAISQGEDLRAGRWWWEDESAKECGLHEAKSSQREEINA